MADFAGNVAPSGVGGLEVTQVSVNLRGRSIARWTFGSVNGFAGQPQGGSLSENTPIPPFPAENLTGQVACSFYDIFYNNVYLLPSQIDFGAVTEETQRTFKVQNLYRVPQTITSISFGNPEGLAVSGPSIPAVLLPFQTLTFVATASAEGPATIGTEMSVTLQGLGTLTVPVTGSRAQLWPFEPNWAAPYRVVLEYLSNILVSHTGKEQRRAIRQTPRKRIEHTSTLTGDQFRRLKGLLASWQHRSWIFPERTRAAFSATPMAANDTEVTLNTVPWWMAPGVSVVLEHGRTQEIREVRSVTPSSVEFTGGSDTPWPAGTKMFFGISGNVAGTLRSTTFTSGVSELGVVLEELPGSAVAEALPGPPETLGGREVFTLRPNWANPISVDRSHEVSIVDFGFGRTSRFSPILFGSDLRQLTFVGRNSDEGVLLEQFFRRQKGQQGEFYMPTWESDMLIAQDVQDNTSLLRVQGPSVFERFEDSSVFRAIMVLLRDGRRVYRQVSSIDVVSDSAGEDSVLNLTAPWGSAIPAASVAMISWLNVCRLASDGITLEWLTSSTVQAQLSIRTLEDLPAEELP